MEVKYQVFVSSTFKDLEVERRQVIEAILNLGHIPVGMEAFQASDDSQWDYIKRRITECDYYVVIVGERYGSEFEGKSYTQMEYEFAMESELPVAAFLMSDAARARLPRELVEFEKASQVTAFRQLCEQKLCKQWENGSDLAGKVILALSELTRERPRRGWVRPSKVAPTEVLQEMAKLLGKNRALQEAVDAMRQKSVLSIPANAMIHIEELRDARLRNYFLDAEGYEQNYTLLDVYLRAALPLAGGIDYMDFAELLRNTFEAFLEDGDPAIDTIMAEYSLRKLVTTRTRLSGRSSTTEYALTDYGKDFRLYAERWERDNEPDPFLPGDRESKDAF